MQFETIDHTPDNKEEIERIESTGGWIIKGRLCGDINITRANIEMPEVNITKNNSDLTAYCQAQSWPQLLLSLTDIA